MSRRRSLSITTDQHAEDLPSEKEKHLLHRASSWMKSGIISFFGLTLDGQNPGDAVNAAALCKMP
jgi:hypothetical protein